MTEIAAPYARELLLEGRPQFAKVAEEVKKRADNQVRALGVCVCAHVFTPCA